MASNVIYPDVITYNGHETYLADDLKTRFLNMFLGCRTSRQVIEKRDIPKDQYFVVKKKGALYEESTLNYMRAKILIKTEWVHIFVDQEANPETSIIPRNAPPILEIREEEKFIDDEGDVYEVEMRGEEKTKDKVRFKGRDLERVFQIPRLREIIQMENTHYQEYEDYEFLLVQDPIILDPGQVKTRPSQVKRENKKRLYFTYQGLIKVITNSRSGVANRFMDWLTQVVFTAHMGDDEAKANLAFELTETNPNVLKTFFSKCMSKMSCVYLFNIGKIKDLKCHEPALQQYNKGFLFKFGRTADLLRRTTEHCGTYGKMTGNKFKLQCFSPVDHLDEVKAENDIKDFFSIGGGFEQSKFVELQNHDELVILDKSELVMTKKFYSDMALKYGASIQRYMEEHNNIKLKLNIQETLLSERQLLIDARTDVIEETNHHIKSMRRELDGIYQTIQILVNQVEEQNEHINILNYEKLYHLQQIEDQGNQLRYQTSHLMSQTSQFNKLLTHANKLKDMYQQNPNDPEIPHLINYIKDHLMTITGVDNTGLVALMEKFRLD